MARNSVVAEAIASPSLTAAARRRAWLPFVLLLTAACGEAAPEAAARRQASAVPDPPGAGRGQDLGDAPLGAGWVIWESDRLGAARIFGRPLDGSAERALTPEESGRSHCCAHFSPDGRSFVYLSLPQEAARYPRGGASGELRRHEIASGRETVLAERARTYFEHRAAAFRDDAHLIYIDGDGKTRELELASGKSRVVVEGPLTEHGWLLDPTLSFATQGTPTFSPYDAASRTVLPRPTLGGCQPYFTGDGRFGFYVAGSGGPIRSLDLRSRKTREILRKGDRRLPEDRRYLYFPMVSRDRTLIAWGASDGGHDHFSADYDIFVAEIDSETLELAGTPLQVTRSPAADRFPDVFSPPGARPRATAPPAAAESRAVVEATSAEALPGEVLVFRGGDHTNLVLDPKSGEEVSTVFEPKGRAFYDRHFALELRGGSFLADMGTMERLLGGVMATNEMSLEIHLEAAAAGPRRGVVFSFSGGAGKRRNFTLAQEAGRLYWQLATESNAGSSGNAPRLDLGKIEPGKPLHLLLTYAAGELVVYRDGQEKARTPEWREGFFPWRPLPLLFGNEWEADEPFHGKIFRATVWDHVIGAAEAAARAKAAAADLAALEAPPLLRTRARLIARSRTPRLEEIAPYRQALAVYEYRSATGESLRVVHRVLEDGEVLPISRLAEGREIELALEPFKSQPQLESLFLSNQLPASDQRLYFSPALDFE